MIHLNNFFYFHHQLAQKNQKDYKTNHINTVLCISSPLWEGGRGKKAPIDESTIDNSLHHGRLRSPRVGRYGTTEPQAAAQAPRAG